MSGSDSEYRAAVITVAGISSRFNKGIDDKDKVLKCLYTESDKTDSLLFQMIIKLSYADKIFVVGGYKYDDLTEYIENAFTSDLKQKISVIYNEHFEDLSSGYSLYLGLKEAFRSDKMISEVLFVEGDLDIDEASLKNVIYSDKTVLTYNFEPIFANKSVVLYREGDGHYVYAYNRSHGLLSITTPFSEIYNSGQTWKFMDMEALKAANEVFGDGQKDGTNLVIIQEYLNRIHNDKVEVLPLKRWTNCNTRNDYRNIKEVWDNEKS